MPSTVLVGTQWGDEGKGKTCDLIAPEFDCVVRYQGGNNAGHTIVVGDKKYGLHQVPSGIMYPDCVSVIGNGCVVNPAVLLEEDRHVRGRRHLHRQPQGLRQRSM